MTPHLALTPGIRLGVYEVIASIGEGGMGQVFRARDTKLDRDVAIKALPTAFAHDADRLARFEREAKTLASLNHPNIAAIYGLEESGGMAALVMELVEGDDLSQRIARGAIPLDEALPIAKQIAEALEAAHEQGIIHRDLKPANIKVRPDGTVKVLDFGLAKAMEPGATIAPSVSQSPTMATPAMTQAGMILGTAAYMSPEQARGKSVDKRADIWAFGVVLYEMLTGARLFAADSVPETLGLIFSHEPDLALLPAATPARVRTLIARCLVKDPRRRLRDTGDARLDLADAQSATPENDPLPGVAPKKRERLAWALAMLMALVAGVLGVRALRPAPVAPETHLTITTPPTRDATLAISPDGLKVVFVARSAGQSQLWLRLLDSPTARPLVGTEGASFPFWSPNSRSIGFFAHDILKRMNLDDGSIQALMSAARVWGARGTTTAHDRVDEPRHRDSPVPAGGGESTAVTRFDSPQQRSHSSPQFLPDQRHFLFFVTGSSEARGVYIGRSIHRTPHDCSMRTRPRCTPRTDSCCSSVTRSCWHNALIRYGSKREETRSR